MYIAYLYLIYKDIHLSYTLVCIEYTSVSITNGYACIYYAKIRTLYCIYTHIYILLYIYTQKNLSKSTNHGTDVIWFI